MNYPLLTTPEPFQSIFFQSIEASFQILTSREGFTLNPDESVRDSSSPIDLSCQAAFDNVPRETRVCVFFDISTAQIAIGIGQLSSTGWPRGFSVWGQAGYAPGIDYVSYLQIVAGDVSWSEPLPRDEARLTARERDRRCRLRVQRVIGELPAVLSEYASLLISHGLACLTGDQSVYSRVQEHHRKVMANKLSENGKWLLPEQ